MMNTLDMVASVDAMTDKTKAYVLNGTIWKYEARYDVLVPTNEIPKSINSDGTPYNGGQGWRSGYYIVAGSGKESANAGYRCTGFIPVKATDIFRLSGYTNGGINYDNIIFYDSSFAYIGAFTATSNYNPLSQFEKDDGTMEACISTAATTNFTDTKKNSIAYMRLSFAGINANTSCIINIFEETAVLKPSSWYDTKIPYYGDVIVTHDETLTTHGEEITKHESLIAKIRRYMGLHI